MWFTSNRWAAFSPTLFPSSFGFPKKLVLRFRLGCRFAVSARRKLETHSKLDGGNWNLKAKTSCATWDYSHSQKALKIIGSKWKSSPQKTMSWVPKKPAPESIPIHRDLVESPENMYDCAEYSCQIINRSESSKDVSGVSTRLVLLQGRFPCKATA